MPPDRLLQVIEMEHEEDLARLGGFLSRASEARMASEEPVLRRLWHRLPWLALGLLGAMASALVVGAFEEELRKQVLLAFFVPAVVYMADAVGTQTETVVIRGMALGVRIRTVFVREIVAGLVIGALLGSLFFLFALAAWGETSVAAAVALSLAISCSVARLVAMALPYALARLGRDPAFGLRPPGHRHLGPALDPGVLRGRRRARHLNGACEASGERRRERPDPEGDSGGDSADEEHLEPASKPAEPGDQRARGSHREQRPER